MSQVVSTQSLEFDMPVPVLGTTVRWYQSGLAESRPPGVGTVIRVFHRSLSILLPSGVRMDAVRHINDPKLQLNADQRECGSWDFTEDVYQRAAWEKKIEERLSAIEASDSPAEEEPVEEKPVAKYHDLRKQAIELGIEFTGNPKAEWLNDQIKEMTDGSSTA